MTNTINKDKKMLELKIHPYHNGFGWVFDDERVGLVAEGLVDGIDTILDRYTAEHKINRKEGLDVTFSAQEIPEYDILLEKMHEVRNDGRNHGTMYYCKKYNIQGWLCPSLYLYLPEAPNNIYVKTHH